MFKRLVASIGATIILLFAFLCCVFWLDAQINAARLAKFVIERSLSGKGVSVQIGQVIPKYRFGKILLKCVHVTKGDICLAKTDQIECSVSVASIRALRINICAGDIVFLEALQCVKISGLCFWDFFASKCVASFEDANSVHLGSISSETNMIDISIKDLVCSRGEMISFAIQGECNQNGLWKMRSNGNLSNVEHVSQLLTQLLKRNVMDMGVLSDCTWHGSWISGAAANLIEDLEFVTQIKLQNCFGSQHLDPIKTMDLSINVQNKKITCALVADALGQGVRHLVHLDLKGDQLSGFGVLDAKVSPLLQRAISCLSASGENCIKQFKMKEPIRWSCILDLKSKHFTWDIATKIAQAAVTHRGREINLENISLVACLSSSNNTFELAFREQALGIDINCTCLLREDYSGSVEAKFTLPQSAKLGLFSFENGSGSVRCSWKVQEDMNSFSTQCDLKNLAFFCDKMGLEKVLHQNAFLQLDGVLSQDRGVVNINLVGDDNLAIEGSCEFEEGEFFVNLEDVCYGSSSYSFQSDYSKSGVFTEIEGEILDLSRADLLEWIHSEFSTKPAELFIKVDLMPMKYLNTLSDVCMYSRYQGAQYVESIFHAYIGEAIFVNVMLSGYDEQHLQERWKFVSNDAGSVVSALGIYDGMNFGFLNIDCTSDRSAVTQQNPDPLISGKLTVDQFHLKESLHPVISALCPSTLMKPFVTRKYTIFDSLVASFHLDKGALYIEKAWAKNFSHDLVIKNAKIATDTSTISLDIAPSWYGFGNMVRGIPILGEILNRLKLPGIWIPYKLGIND